MKGLFRGRTSNEATMGTLGHLGHRGRKMGRGTKPEDHYRTIWEFDRICDCPRKKDTSHKDQTVIQPTCDRLTEATKPQRNEQPHQRAIRAHTQTPAGQGLRELPSGQELELGQKALDGRCTQAWS